MKKQCSVVRDLMPLVLDRVASDDSRELIENHLNACEECRKQYNDMKANLPEESRAAYEADQRQFVEAMKAVKKKRLQRRLLSLGVAFICCVVAAFGGLFAYDRLFWQYTVPVDNTLYTLSLCQLANGNILVNADMSNINFNTNSEVSEVYDNDAGILYVALYTTPIPSKYQNGDAGHRIHRLAEFEESSAITEIRQGTPKDYVVLWKQGEPITDASQEMEVFLTMEEQYWTWLEQENEHSAWHEQMDAALFAVPEWN